MPKVIIIPDNQVESVCQDAVTFANSCQSDFKFYLVPQVTSDNSPLNKRSAEVFDILKYLENLKRLYNYQTDDLVLAFYNGVLTISSHGLSNLFLAGSRYNETQPCTGVISLKYLGWNILEEKYNYEVQKHSILHLIICGIIGSYTHLEAHHDIGCLLDKNMQLTSFNLKLQKGYYLCSKQEFGCYDNIKKGKYGNAIIQLCEKFKSNNYQTVINEIIMGTKIQVGDIHGNTGIIAICKDIKISNSLNKRKEVADKIDELIKLLQQENIASDQRQTLITNFDKVKDEITDEEEPSKSKIFKWLSNTKEILENVVLANHTREAIHWIYENFHFVIQSIL